MAGTMHRQNRGLEREEELKKKKKKGRKEFGIMAKSWAQSLSGWGQILVLASHLLATYKVCSFNFLSLQ